MESETMVLNKTLLSTVGWVERSTTKNYSAFEESSAIRYPIRVRKIQRNPTHNRRVCDECWVSLKFRSFPSEMALRKPPSACDFS